MITHCKPKGLGSKLCTPLELFRSSTYLLRKLFQEICPKIKIIAQAVPFYKNKNIQHSNFTRSHLALIIMVSAERALVTWNLKLIFRKRKPKITQKVTEVLPCIGKVSSAILNVKSLKTKVTSLLANQNVRNGLIPSFFEGVFPDHYTTFGFVVCCLHKRQFEPIYDKRRQNV